MMTAKRLFVSVVFAAALAAGSMASVSSKASAEPVIKLDADSARIVKLASAPSTVVVSNPLYADVSVQGERLVLIGKSTGRTDVIVMDFEGKQLAKFKVIVRRAEDQVVTLYKGGQRHTLHCEPFCDETLVVNDEKKPFDDRVQSLESKFGLSSGSGAGGAAAQ